MLGLITTRLRVNGSKTLVGLSRSHQLDFFKPAERSRCCSSVPRYRLQDLIKKDGNECENQMRKHGKFILFHQGKPLMNQNAKGTRKEPLLVTFEQALQYDSSVQSSSVFLRVHPSMGPVFALTLPESTNANNIETDLNANFTNLRAAMFLVDEKTWFVYLCQATSLLRWNAKTTYCSNCGSNLKRNAAGGQRECDGCKSVYYPVTSPVAIVLLSDIAHSKVLLIRQPVYPKGMFSCVAGFVDMGETLFECARREVAEEIGLDILENKSIQYMDSQFWPLPTGSLMCGVMAYVDSNIPPKPCLDEVEQARWFSMAELFEALERVKKNPGLRISPDNDPNNVFVPPRGAIANSLLRTWLKDFAKYSG